MGDTHSGEPTVLKLKELPLCDLVWVNENTLVGAGHNFFPRTFVKDANGWSVGKNLDEQQGTGPKKTTGTRAAFSMFQNKVKLVKIPTKLNLRLNIKTMSTVYKEQLVLQVTT